MMQTEPLQVKGRDVWYWRLSSPYKHEREWDGDVAYGNMTAAAKWAGSVVTVGARRQFHVGVPKDDGYMVFAENGDYIVQAAGQFVVFTADAFAAAFS